MKAYSLIVSAISMALFFSLCSVQAETQPDENLVKNFSYHDANQKIKPEASVFYMNAPDKTADSQEADAHQSKPQCVAVNKQFVNCFRPK